jgi:hypothetical protein
MHLQYPRHQLSSVVQLLAVTVAVTLVLGSHGVGVVEVAALGGNVEMLGEKMSSEESADYLGRTRLIYEAVHLHDRVMLFGKSLHKKLNYLTTHFSDGARCTHGGQKWKNITVAKEETGFEFACIFGPEKNNAAYRTRVKTVTEQVIGCEHPAKEVQEEMIGHNIRFKITYQGVISYVPSNAVYEGQPPPPPPPPTKKPYYFCACITMWYRSEFLLEWARYHQLVHGFEKIFVYDNDSDLDQLSDTTRLINSSLPIERVDWPYQQVQPAYMAHCLLRARPQCTWVSFFDVDEFAYAKQSDGRLDTILRETEKSFPTIGALEVQMASMVPTANVPLGQLMRKPDHGIVRNYQCRYKSTNIKTIARSDTVMESLMSGVHFFCYKEGYNKKTLKSTSNPVLYHYTTQAWEVMMRKHVRRASPASKPFYGRVALDNPSQKWAHQATESCKYEDHTMNDHTLCVLSYKVVPNCSAPVVGQLLITGTGGVGSGLDWMDHALSRKMGSLGHSHEMHQSEVLVDWKLAVLRPPTLSSHDPFVTKRYKWIFHQVREPLEAITAIAATYTAKDWEAVKQASGFDPVSFSDPIVRALHHWVLWNQLTELISDWRYRVEDVSMEQICTDAVLAVNCASKDHDADASLPRTLPRLSTAATVTWHALDKLDSGVARLARGMAIKYGYTLPADYNEEVKEAANEELAAEE